MAATRAWHVRELQRHVTAQWQRRVQAEETGVLYLSMSMLKTRAPWKHHIGQSLLTSLEPIRHQKSEWNPPGGVTVTEMNRKNSCFRFLETRRLGLHLKFLVSITPVSFTANTFAFGDIVTVTVFLARYEGWVQISTHTCLQSTNQWLCSSAVYFPYQIDTASNTVLGINANTEWCVGTPKVALVLIGINVCTPMPPRVSPHITRCCAFIPIRTFWYVICWYQCIFGNNFESLCSVFFKDFWVFRVCIYIFGHFL